MQSQFSRKAKEKHEKKRRDLKLLSITRRPGKVIPSNYERK